MFNIKLLEHTYQTTYMVIVCMGDNHMVNVIAGIILVDVFDNRVGSVGTTTVNDVEVITVCVLTISDDDRVAIAVANRKKVNFIRHKHLRCIYEIGL